MAKVSMKALLESGVHFGHRTHRWHPHMRPYIFTERNGIHIIDLQQTVKAMEEVADIVSQTVANGGNVLFVGTKRQAVETIEEEANRCGMPYVTFRWLGGMLTNWFTMRQRINELDRLERMREKGEFELITKKEGLMLSRKIDKLQARFGGIRHMHKLPDLLFIVDVRREETAVREANSLSIPIIALVDTNCDPRDIDYVIPSNDDAIRTIKLMVGFIADAVEEGRAMRKDDDSEEIVVTAPVKEMEQELSDEDLLGESTLAKMEAEAAAEAEAAEAEAAKAEAAAAEEEAEEAEEAATEEETAAAEEADADVSDDEE
ncbi:MAG: 30S ribosomal protein S2 [Anaerolineales bacterium]